MSNKKKRYNNYKIQQSKRKVLGVIPKNYVNKERKIIEFLLRAMTENERNQVTKIKEWSFIELRLVRQ